MSLSASTEAIDLSVVIASHNAARVIASCLDALERQTMCPRMEVIVADSSSDGTDAIVRSRFTFVRLLHFDELLTLPELRGRGIALASGAVIAILDPFSITADDWARHVVRAHAKTSNLVIGGLVDLHRADEQGWFAWAIYLNEYGLFLPPVRCGPAPIVPGSNVSYKRSLLFNGPYPRYEVFWKTFVNWEAEARGSVLWLEPQIRVALDKPIPFGDYFRTRYLHGRCFAGMRSAGIGWPMRLVRAASAPLLPALLLARWTRGIWPKRRRRGTYLVTLPLQFALFSMWAWGECCGYLRGPGKTCRQLFY